MVDGYLEEAEWRRAPAITDLRLAEPVEGGPASQATEVRILFDAEAIYFGFRCHDGDPGAITASAMVRDQTQRTDDRVLVVLDTFHERRSGYAFGVNANGARYDALIEDHGGFNEQWDGIWFAASRIDDGGWTAELAVPFHTLNFDPGARAWGLNVGRGIPRSNEFARWAFPDPDVFFFDVAHFGDLEGIGDLEQGLGLDVVPAFVLSQHRDNAADRAVGRFDPTADVFYKITPSLTAVATANTDFSEAPPDRRLRNLTRFSLFFPERRDFFLQDSGIFSFAGLSQNGRPFFSRRIGITPAGPIDIRFGGKLTGRIGRLNLGALSTRVEGHDGVASKWLSVGRAFLNVGEESTLGVIGTYGNPDSDAHNKLLGADFNYRSSHAFGSRILEGSLWAQKTSSPGSGDREAAFGASLRFPNDRWSWELSALEIQENFDPALGFANRRAIRDYGAELQRRWRPGGYVRWFDARVEGRLVTGTDGDLQSATLTVDPIEVMTDIGDRVRLSAISQREDLLADFEIRTGIVIPRDSYRFERGRLELESSRSRPVELDVAVEYGGFLGGTRLDAIAELEWRPSRHLFLGLDYEQFQVHLPQGDFTARIARARADVALTPDVSWTNLIQWDNETDELTVSSRFRWIIEPGRELFVSLDPFFQRDDRLKLASTTTDAAFKLRWTFRY